MRDPVHRVSPRAMVVWAAGALLQGIVAAAALTVAAEVWHWFPMPWWAWSVYVVVALAYLAVMPTVRYRIHRWETTDVAVYTQTGWLTRERRVAPMSRVQTVDLGQGPVSRLLGLASVTATTASAAGPLEIQGLDRAVAEHLVAELTRRTADLAGDAT